MVPHVILVRLPARHLWGHSQTLAIRGCARKLNRIEDFMVPICRDSQHEPIIMVDNNGAQSVEWLELSNSIIKTSSADRIRNLSKKFK